MGMYNNCGVADPELDFARRTDELLSAGRTTESSYSEVRKTIYGNKEVVLIAMQNTMYEGTPSLALDTLVYQAQLKHPGWGFTVVEMDADLEPVVDRKTESGWQRLDFESLRDVVEVFDPMVVGYSATSKDVKTLTDLVAHEVDTTFRRVIAGGAGIKASRDMIIKKYGFKIDAVFDAGDASARIFTDMLYDPLNWEAGEGTLHLAQMVDGAGSDQYVKYEIPEFIPVDSISEKTAVPANHQRTANWNGKTIYRIQTASGCGYPCTFCALGKDYQIMSIEEVKVFLDSVVADIKNKGLSRDDIMVFLEDANVGGDTNSKTRTRMLDHANQLLELFSEYQLNFGVQVRYDNLSDDYIDMLSEGNVTYIYTSVESSDPGVLKGMGKSQKGDVNEIYDTFKKVREAGIEYGISFIRGTKADTPETFMRTANLVNTLAPEFAFMEIAKVYPGTADAVRYQRENDVDVSSTYILGRNLVNNPLLGPENNRALLLISEDAAIAAINQTRDLFTVGQGKLNLGLEPLAENYTYRMDAPGFFTRVSME